MAAVSGQYGKIQADGSTLVECTQWSFTREVAEHVYASCSTSQKRDRVAGPQDVTGSSEGIFDPDDPIESYVEPGDKVVLKLYFTASKYHQVPVMIINLEEAANIEGGEIVRWTASWGLSAGTGTLSWNQSD